MNNGSSVTLSIREATPADISCLETLVNLAYRGGKASVAWKNENHLVTGPRTTREELQAKISSQSTTILVCEAGKEIKGSVLIENKAGCAHIGMLSVHPETQNLGIGKMLLTKAEEYARNNFQSKEAVMCVLSGRPELLSWYEKLGYGQTGEVAPFPNNPEIGLQSLSSDAHFHVISKTLIEPE